MGSHCSMILCLPMMTRTDCLSRRGYSAIEILLVVALIGILGGVSLPLSRFVQERNDLDLAAMAVAQSLRKAKVYTEASRLDSSWGVRLGNGSITLFRGDDFATRDPVFDEAFALGSGITAAGLTQVAFAGLPASPSAGGSITLTTPRGRSSTLSVSPNGMISY